MAVSHRCLFPIDWLALRRRWPRRSIVPPHSPSGYAVQSLRLMLRRRCTSDSSIPEHELPAMALEAVEERTKSMQVGETSQLVGVGYLSLDDVTSIDDNSKSSSSVIDDVQNTAIRLLASRGLTAAELRTKLKDKNFPVQMVGKVLADIKDRGYLDDAIYAESFSRSRWLSSTWGPRKIKQVLTNKGVSEADVDTAMKKVFNSDDSSRGGPKNDPMMSESSMEHLFRQASKQWMRTHSLPLAKRRARILRWLQYRGFNWTVTNSIIKKLEGDHPESD